VGHDLRVEAEPGHDQEDVPASPEQVRGPGTPANEKAAQEIGVSLVSHDAGGKVLGACGQHGHGQFASGQAGGGLADGAVAPANHDGPMVSGDSAANLDGVSRARRVMDMPAPRSRVQPVDDAFDDGAARPTTGDRVDQKMHVD
jgi:hypothetical protein